MFLLISCCTGVSALYLPASHTNRALLTDSSTNVHTPVTAAIVQAGLTIIVVCIWVGERKGGWGRGCTGQAQVFAQIAYSVQ
eukprot:COSAG01_NODE_4763_length_4757_cov_12.979390_4_plen_82_part_00